MSVGLSFTNDRLVELERKALSAPTTVSRRLK
jgi:hypothetical protein